jgi:hypothetical protein
MQFCLLPKIIGSGASAAVMVELVVTMKRQGYVPLMVAKHKLEHAHLEA